MPEADRRTIAVGLADRGWYLEADRFCNCGRRIHKFVAEDFGLEYGIRETCKSRICDRCAESMFRKFRDNGLRIVKTLPRDPKRRVSFMTLTFKTRPLTKKYIRDCEKAVRLFVNRFFGRWFYKYNRDSGKFRQTKNRIDCGAIAVLEIGPAGNVHFHLLVFGYFHPFKFMSKVWSDLTGDSYRIDIRQVSQATKDSPKYAIEYILKYIRKPPAFHSPAQYVDFLDLLKGIRRLHTYGVFYNNPGWKPDRDRFECPFTGCRLVYAGPAAPGEVVLNFSIVSDEFLKARDPAIFLKLLKNAAGVYKDSSAGGEGMKNPAFDSRTYRDPEHQTEKPISRCWCYVSSQISLDSLI